VPFSACSIRKGTEKLLFSISKGRETNQKVQSKEGLQNCGGDKNAKIDESLESSTNRTPSKKAKVSITCKGMYEIIIL